MKNYGEKKIFWVKKRFFIRKRDKTFVEGLRMMLTRMVFLLPSLFITF